MKLDPGLQFKKHPIIITPYDELVDKAYHEIQPSPEVDVIKLEPSCQGDKIAWVSNEDLLKGKPGQQRVIHICLKKLKDEYQKKFKEPFSVTNSKQREQIKGLIKDKLKYIVIPHEMKHVEQEITHGGEFPGMAEQEAEHAEKRREFEKEHMFKLAINKLDKIADILETKGLIKQAYRIDKMSDWMEQKPKEYSIIEEMKNSPHQQVRNEIAKMIVDLNRQGVTSQKSQEEAIKTILMRRSLGPYSIRE